MTCTQKSTTTGPQKRRGDKWIRKWIPDGQAAYNYKMYCYCTDNRVLYRHKKYLIKGAIIMSTKSANLYVRIEPDVKEQAESILSALGISASNAINMFYKQIILQRGLPFEVKIPSAKPVDMSVLSEEEMNAELENGYADRSEEHTSELQSPDHLVCR